MDLVALPDRPIPPGIRAGLVGTPDGLQLRYARWEPTEGVRRGTVVLAQGRAEFIEKYFDIVDELRARGFGVVTFDWRGQGGSSRQVDDLGKGHVRRFSDYETDLETIMTVVALPDCRPPFFALAHSMGGAVMMRIAKAGRTWFDRMVLSSPMLGLASIPFEPGARALARTLRLAGLGTRYVPGGTGEPVVKKPFAGNPVSSDPIRYARTALYPDIDARLGLGAPTVAWIDEAFKVTQEFAHPLYPADIRQPILIVASGDDRLVSTTVTEAFGARLKTGRTLVIPGAKHELMMERDIIRAQFLAAFDAFVPGEQPFL